MFLKLFLNYAVELKTQPEYRVTKSDSEDNLHAVEDKWKGQNFTKVVLTWPAKHPEQKNWFSDFDENWRKSVFQEYLGFWWFKYENEALDLPSLLKILKNQ